jgi:hypothetical protein
MQFSTAKRSHGNLKDQDRIFTNLYKDGTPFVEGALKRVNIDVRLIFINYRVIGTEPKTY